MILSYVLQDHITILSFSKKKKKRDIINSFVKKLVNNFIHAIVV